MSGLQKPVALRHPFLYCSDQYAGEAVEMPARPILFVVAGIAVLIAFAVAALSYMRAVNALSDFVARSKPNGWIGGGPYRLWFGDRPRPLRSNWWIDNVLFGLGRLDISGESYRALLRMARMRLLACLVLFLILVAGLGWYTQGSMDRAMLARINGEYDALVARGLIGRSSGGEAQKPRMLNTYVGDAVAPVSQGKSAPIVLPLGPRMATPDAH